MMVNQKSSLFIYNFWSFWHKHTTRQASAVSKFANYSKQAVASHHTTSHHITRRSLLCSFLLYMCATKATDSNKNIHIHMYTKCCLFYLSWYDTTFRIPWASERESERARANELALPFCTNSKHTADKSTLEREKEKRNSSLICIFVSLCCLFLLNRIITLFLLTMFVAQDCLV